MAEAWPDEPAVGDVPYSADMDVRDLSNKQVMVGLCIELGYNAGDRSRVTKRMLNSALWALTGEHYAWRRFGTRESPDSGELRWSVAQAAGFWYSSGQLPKPRGDERAKRYTLPQRRALLHALRENDVDQRNQFGGDGE